MKLFFTPNSPYARICRIAAVEGGLGDRVQEIAVTTRDTNSAYYQITPLARVPALVDGDCLIADTRDICAHFDQLSGRPQWLPPETAKGRTERNIAAGFLDGVCVWLRENARPEGEKSLAVMHYEDHRAKVALRWLEDQVFQPERMDFSALAVICAVDMALRRGMAQGWDGIAPNLMRQVEKALDRPAFRASEPLPLA